MIARYNRVWVAPPKKATPYKIEYEFIEKIVPISFNEDKSIKEYTKEEKYIEKKTKWKDYIRSFDLGSPSEQMLSHINKGTPLITGHTLPHADYTQLERGAEIVKLMKSKGITLEMLESALASQEANKVKEGESNG